MGKNLLPRLHLPLPLDEQKLFVPGWSCHCHLQIQRDGHFLLLWSSEMQDSSTLRFVSSRLTPPQWGQTHVPPLQSLHGTRRNQTADQAKPSPSSHQVGPCLVGQTHVPPLQNLHGTRRNQTADQAKPSLSSHQVRPCLVGTWPTPELQEAINQGYIVQHVYKVWHFSRNSNYMFSSYVDTFLKIKQEASRWPDWVGDDEDKRHQYIEDYRTKEGITLEADKIQKNPG